MKVRFKRIDHITLVIPENGEEKARRFYRDVLGLKEIPKPESLVSSGGMWFEIGDIQLHLSIGDPTTSSKRHPAFEVEDIDALKTYFRKIELKISEHTPIPGLKRFSIYDPFDNRIELLEKVM